MVDVMQGSENYCKKTMNRTSRSFHFRYLELCRSKNYTPVSEVKAKNNITSVLDFFGDKIRVDDWLLIIESLHYDQVLQNISLRLRKNLGYVLENLDSDKKAKMLKKQPVIYTKFIFSHLIEAISNNIKCNRNLNTLNLEGLPIDSIYIISISKALSINENLQTLSFNRSSIGDEGCEAICSTVKCLLHIESISMIQCQLTVKGAVHIADMIKFQKIYRYSEGWKKSLRYRDVNPDSIPGLRSIIISQNNIGDKGTELITEILKEDVWIKGKFSEFFVYEEFNKGFLIEFKEIDLSECGLTDLGGKFVLDCLEINKYITEFRIKNNTEMSSHLMRTINEQLGKEENRDVDNTKKNKINVPKIRERVKMLEEQIVSEKNLRKQVENLNEQLHAQIMCYERKLTEEPEIPEGYTLIKVEELDELVKERDEFKNAVSAIKLTKSRSLRKISKIRKARSETKYKDYVMQNNSRSEHVLNNYPNVKQTPAVYKNLMSTYVEKNIGDTVAMVQHNQQTQQQSSFRQQNFIRNNQENVADDGYNDKEEFYSNEQQPDKKNIEISQNKTMTFKGIEEAMKLFTQKKQNLITQDNTHLNNNQVNSVTNARSLFMGNN